MSRFGSRLLPRLARNPAPPPAKLTAISPQRGPSVKEQEFLRGAQCLALHRDATRGTLLARYQACDGNLNVRSGVFGVSQNFGSSAADIRKAACDVYVKMVRPANRRASLGSSEIGFRRSSVIGPSSRGCRRRDRMDTRAGVYWVRSSLSPTRCEPNRRPLPQAVAKGAPRCLFDLCWSRCQVFGFMPGVCRMGGCFSSLPRIRDLSMLMASCRPHGGLSPNFIVIPVLSAEMFSRTIKV